jgi:hypothetical protein
MEFEMTRERWLSLFVAANKTYRELGLDTINLDDPEALKVAFMSGPMVIPTIDSNGEKYHLLVIADEEHWNQYQEHVGSDEAWPHFENDLRDVA